MSGTTTLHCLTCQSLWIITMVSDGNLLHRCPACHAPHPLTIGQWWSRQDTASRPPLVGEAKEGG